MMNSRALSLPENTNADEYSLTVDKDSACSSLYPKSIHYSAVGIKSNHTNGYKVGRSLRSDGYLLEYFEGPVILEDANSTKLYSHNVFILLEPGQRQYFQAAGSISHTWVQLTGSGVAECVKSYKIPVNQAIELKDFDFLAPMLQDAVESQVRKHRHWEDEMTELFRTLFRRIARTLYDHDSHGESPTRRQLISVMYTIRAQVYKDLKRRWTVDDMAALANMSVQRFAVIYRECFGTGPIDDLIDVRIRHADLMLRHMPITVVDAAFQSGFNTGSNFHVLFRERMGHSPRGRRRVNERMLSASMDENLFETSDSARLTYLKYIRPTGYWSFDQDGSDVVDEMAKHPALTLHNEVEKVQSSRGGSALRFSGRGYAMIPEPVVDTSKSYTVCAWLKRDRQDRMIAVSVGNDHHGAFYLQYNDIEGGYKFAVTVSELDPFSTYVISDHLTPDNEWNFVTGVHDAERHEISLYVDSQLIGSAPYSNPWHADGFTYFGCCRVMDTILGQWVGEIDDIRLYDSALTSQEISVLYKDEASNG